jgi:protein phosphatase
MNLEIPESCLVVIVGVSGSGKSTFARKHFAATEIVSSDTCRGLVADDENDQDATGDAFTVLGTIVDRRLARGRLAVVDATNTQSSSRASLVALARAQDRLAVAIVLEVPAKVAAQRNASRSDRSFGAHVVRQQAAQLDRGLSGLKREGFSRVYRLDSPESIEAVTITRTRMRNDRRDDHGPFDIIGDVHGCYDELRALLGALGYTVSGTREAPEVVPPPGRHALFLGDLVDRGPDSPGVLRLVMHMVERGHALCVPGNHDMKLVRKLRGRDIKLAHGLAQTMEQLEREPPEQLLRIASFLDGLVSHLVLDDGKLVVAHAGLREDFQGRASGRVRAFCLYGDTTGEIDEFGMPVRLPWATEYRGRAMVVYGHTPTPEAEWINRTICIDTGCVFGGKLTALRYPERELIEVPAAEVYYEPVRPIAPVLPERPAEVLDLQDVAGKRIVTTRVRHTVTIREENAVAALEVMSRFAIDPRWLVYLPPTMAPGATAPAGTPLLERPEDVLEDFARAGVSHVVCERKHMGSRAVVIVTKDASVAARRFGVPGTARGVVYTRTGRAFFADAALEQALLERLAAAVAAAGLWEELATDWLCLDVELMPWSLKARELLRTQYAAVGAAGRAATSAATAVLAAAAARGAGDDALTERYRDRGEMIEAYGRAWRGYCWDTVQLDAVQVAPFHLLASEGRTWFDHDHVWHMDTLARIAAHDPLVVATPYRVVALDDPAAREDASAWWHALTDAGGEGMVVKPLQWLTYGKRGLVQPALKCRGREYLRIIYGPEYTAPDQLERLRGRGLQRKRRLALAEFALGAEALYRFVAAEPLWRVHECVFGVLALESEPVDPRL